MALTPRQQRFVEEYCADLTFNGSEAARRAGYQGNTRTIATMSNKLLSNPTIAAAVQAHKATLAERCAVTLESVTEQLHEDRRLAHTVGQPGAAVSASMGLAKLHGLITDRQELTGKNGVPLVPGKMLVELVDPADLQSSDTA